MLTRILAVSGLSQYDRATLSATFWYSWDDRLNCARALEALSKRTKNLESAQAIVRGKFGCDRISDKPRVVIDGIGFHSCLCNFNHPLFNAYLDLTLKLDVGILPDRGAYLDQPAQALDGIALLNRLRNEAQAAESAKREKELKHGRK